MSLFVVILPKEDPALVAAIKEKFPNNYYQITPTQWIISARGTAQQLSDLIGVTGEEKPIGLAVILAIAGYWGRASTDLWEWMRVKTEEKANG